MLQVQIIAHYKQFCFVGNIYWHHRSRIAYELGQMYLVSRCLPKEDVLAPQVAVADDSEFVVGGQKLCLDQVHIVNRLQSAEKIDD